MFYIYALLGYSVSFLLMFVMSNDENNLPSMIYLWLETTLLTWAHMSAFQGNEINLLFFVSCKGMPSRVAFC